MSTRNLPSTTNPQSFMYSECDFWTGVLVVYLIQKAQEKIIARSSRLLWWLVVIVCVMIWANTELVYAMKSKVRESVCLFI